MSDSLENRPSIYYIPENFLGESRILNGQIRVRYLVDSIALSAILATIFGLPILLLAVPGATFNVKITVLVICIAPGFLVGQIGCNGDPISVFLINVYRWRKKRQVRLYNERPRLLGTDPVKALYESNRGMDKVVGFVQNMQEKRIEIKTSEVFVEGETFEFQYDPGIDGYLEDIGDYDDDHMNNKGKWPETAVSIASGTYLDGLDEYLKDEDSDEGLCERQYEKENTWQKS